MAVPGRNDRCPCGSGKKFKKCCGATVTGTDPNVLESLLADALRLYKSGNYSQAEVRFERVLDIDPRNAQALSGLGMVRCSTGNPDEAVPLLLDAAALNGSAAGFCFNIANTLLSLGRAAEACQVTERALKSNPRYVDLLLLHGDCLGRLNRHEEAIRVLERANQLYPGHPPIVRVLARCYRQRKQYARAEALLEGITETLDGSDSRTAKLWQELGLVKDKLGHYSEAIAAVERYGQMVLASPEASKVDERLRIEQITAKLDWIRSGGLSRTRQPAGPQARSPVFLVGFPRSGTTLTEQVLAAHPRIVSSEEQSPLGWAYDALLEQCGREKTYADVMEMADAQALQRAAEAYWRRAEASCGEDIDVFVDKLPLNIIELELIATLFPGAKIIVALRDPRDVCLSCLFQDFALNSSMKNFLRWETTTAFYAEVMGYYQEIKDQLQLSMLEIRYEDTVDNLPEQARRILDHIGVEWDEAVLGYYRQTSERFINTPSYQAVREPIYTQARGRWRNYPDTMKQAMPDLERFIEAFGYIAE